MMIKQDVNFMFKLIKYASFYTFKLNLIQTKMLLLTYSEDRNT